MCSFSIEFRWKVPHRFVIAFAVSEGATLVRFGLMAANERSWGCIFFCVMFTGLTDYQRGRIPTLIIPPLHRRGYTVLPLPVRPKIFFSATIDGRNLIFGHKLHIVGSVFRPVRSLLPDCRLSWFLYTLNIQMYMRGYHKVSISSQFILFYNAFDHNTILLCIPFMTPWLCTWIYIWQNL